MYIKPTIVNLSRHDTPRIMALAIPGLYVGEIIFLRSKRMGHKSYIES